MLGFQPPKWKIVQHRWLRWSEQIYSNTVWEGSRKKQAKGEAKSLFISHLSMMLKHNLFSDDTLLEEENFTCILFDDEGPWYMIWYEIIGPIAE